VDSKGKKLKDYLRPALHDISASGGEKVQSVKQGGTGKRHPSEILPTSHRRGTRRR